MDYLSSLNISYLPEHQTKLNHNDKLIKKLELQQSSSSNINLGISVCCNCGSSNIKIQCEKCKRVKYCSKRCRKEDSTTINNNDDMDDDEPISEGHTTIICSLLNICNIDESVEDIILKQQGGNDSNNNIDKKDFEEAEIRIKSEYESYPATISDFLMEDWLRSSLQKQTKNAKLKKNTYNTSNAITIHIIGASDDGELCTTFLDTNNIITTYYDALADIMEIQQWNEINLCFIGPEINNNTNKSNTKTWKINEKNYKLTISSYKGDYSDYINSNPDIVIFFNPGFTCTDDYTTWENSLDTIPNVPFLITTNTQMEAMSDLQYLHDKQFITSLPSFLNDDGHDEDDDNEEQYDDDEKSIYIFQENPSAGLRVRQSNTMANDLYRKSGWMFGGIFHNIKKSSSSIRNDSSSNTNENISSSSSKSKSNPKKNKFKDCDDVENDSNSATSHKKQKKKYFI